MRSMLRVLLELPRDYDAFRELVQSLGRVRSQEFAIVCCLSLSNLVPSLLVLRD